MKALINARVYDYHTFHQNVFIVFDDKIIEIGPMSSFDKDGIDEVIDVHNNLIMPGFICSHTHLYSAFARGLSVPFNPKNFREILEQMWWKLDHFLDNDMIYSSAITSGLDQVMKGSTTLIDHHASYFIKGSLNRIKQALVDDIGIRAILAFETSDRFDVGEAIKENASFYKTNKGPKVSGLFGLHASFTLSDETLREVSKNLNGAGIHIHVGESIKDEEDSMEKYGKTVIERLDDFGLINDSSILVHCTNASEKELDIIKARNATIAINVTSNMNNAVGLPNIRMMVDKEINIMFGNDGLIQSMPIEFMTAYYTAHLKTKNPIGFSIDEIKQAIINSYNYVSKQLNIKIGEIKKDFVSDFIVVPYNEFTPLDKTNIFGHLFFGVFPGLLPKHVIANGKFIVKNYEVDKELHDKCDEANILAKKLWKTIEKEGKDLEYII